MLPHITAAMIDNWKSFHMLKRLCLALAGLFAFISVASGAGTVPGFSLTPQFDLSGKVAPGCRLYILQAGTTSTPQNAYQDTGLTQVLPNPLTCDAAGRIQQWFVTDGTIKLRLTDRNGVQLFVGDNLLVVGPSSGGGGGGGTVDPTTIAATGDLKAAYGTAVLSGWVRANGRTIGSATSGATERANADCQALFVYLWGVDANLTVSGGRGASAAADWAANKTIALPDMRGRAVAGLDDMGNSSAGRLTSSFFGTTATALGAAGGSEKHFLTIAELPASPPSHGDIDVSNLSVSHPMQGTVDGGTSNPTFFRFGNNTSAPTTNNIAVGGTATMTGLLGGGAAHATATPSMVMTLYLKL